MPLGMRSLGLMLVLMCLLPSLMRLVVSPPPTPRVPNHSPHAPHAPHTLVARAPAVSLHPLSLSFGPAGSIGVRVRRGTGHGAGAPGGWAGKGREDVRWVGGDEGLVV